ncbi:structure-specific endonuclease subunit SLX4 [Paracoccidioides brasiliensis]|nr:structure-specific endonuclease subunit SLX4 [Paracoccidioides brasiliensis]
MNPATMTRQLSSDGRMFASSIITVIPDSSPTAAEAIELSSPLSLPSPTSLLDFLSTSTSRGPARSDTDGDKTQGKEVLDTRPILENSFRRENRVVSGTGGKAATGKKLKRRTESPGNVCQSEIHIVPGERIILRQTRPDKKAAKAKRTKKEDGLINRKLYGRVSKANQTVSLQPETKKSAPKGCNDTTQPAENGHINDLDDGLQLEQAIQRRLDWTPTKDTTIPVIDLVGDSPSSCEKSLSGMRSTRTMLSNYEFSGIVGTLGGSRSEGTPDAPTTKRPVELLKVNNLKEISGLSDSRQSSITEDSESATSKPRRVKAKNPPKSKLTTITSYATAKYTVVEKSVDLDPVETLLSDEPGKEKNVAKRTSGARCAKPGRKKSATTEKKNEPPIFKVVPPLEAFKAFDGQELLFGTSSQLANGHSEDRHEQNEGTSHISNSSAFIPLSRSESSSKAPSQTSLGSGFLKLSSSKNLWSAGARDLTGAVLEIDEIDLSEHWMKPSIFESQPKAPLGCKADTQIPPQLGEIDFDNSCQKPLAAIDPPELVTQSETPSEKGDLHKYIVKPTHINSCSQSGSSISVGSPEKPVQDKPIFSGFTTSELAKKVAAYGFKPIKSRDKMIALLEKCWENRNKTSNSVPKLTPGDGLSQVDESTQGQSLGQHLKPNSIPQTATTQVPKVKPDKRDTKSQDVPVPSRRSTSTSKVSRKRTESPSAILVDDDQRSDSTGDSVPPSRHRRPSKSCTPRDRQKSPESFNLPTIPLAIRSGKIPSTGTASETPSLSTQITAAIKAQPRLRAFNGVKQPTWYEKILMYDPIQLEDLAVWLNTDGFERIGEDREVCPGLVREWCESKGVCCIWRKQRGVRAHCPLVRA